MKDVRDIAKKYMAPLCEPERMIQHVMNMGFMEKLPYSVSAKEVKCPMCNGSEGFWIPYDNIWSCLQDDCIQRNCKKPVYVPTAYKISTDLMSYGVEEEFSNANLNDCQQPQVVLSALKAFAENPKGFLTLAGNNGSGKTYAACACMRAYLMAKKDSAKFITLPEMRMIWVELKRSRENETSFLEKYLDYEFLILDDIGLTIPSDSFLDFLFMLIDKRRSRKKGIIFTTNLSSKELIDRFGNAIGSRVLSGQAFKLFDEDRRATYVF